MRGTVAWTGERWLPTDQARLGVDDLGFLQGVVVVDRLRTVQGVPLDVEPHLSRLIRSGRALGIALPPVEKMAVTIEDCVARNRAAFAGRDFSIVTIATPGPIGQQPPQPTLIIHPAAINWERLHAWYEQGQALYVSEHRNVPSACWSPALKTRSRLQYYLADREAAEQAAHAEDPRVAAHVGGVLLDLNDNLTETSQANLLIVEPGPVLVAPPAGSILEGICLQRTLAMAQSLGLQVRREPIDERRARAAQELLLCGSTGLFWTASQLGPHKYATPTTQPVYRQLRQAWCDAVGFDYCQQARELTAMLDA